MESQSPPSAKGIYIYILRHGKTLYTEWCAVLTLRVPVAVLGLGPALRSPQFHSTFTSNPV